MIDPRASDVCLILEGTYPYVTGGVSAWTHELIQRQDHLSFHIISLMPRDEKLEMKYELPDNVDGITTIHLQRLPAGKALPEKTLARMFEALKDPLQRFTTDEARLEEFRIMLEAMSRHKEQLGEESLLNSEASWKLLSEMYDATYSESSMLDYFWSWRALLAGLYSLVLPELPEARVYHALSTGYAGMLAARCKIEKGRPVILTEHGIYTNERRIELASADWLNDASRNQLTIDNAVPHLRDFWTQSFANYSRICYQASDRIITLFTGNQEAQLHDGAVKEKMRVIPNGVDIDRFSGLDANGHDASVVALIGRVVPIKDIKTFIRAIAMLRDQLPDIQAYIMGPTDEDEDYYQECQDMVEYFVLGKNIEFTGKVVIDDWLPNIDVNVISSISEAQPLVILETGAAGIPTIATDVGACREMIEGRPHEKPALGDGGVVVPLSNPRALASAMLLLLTDRAHYLACSQTIAKRVATYYNKDDQHIAYRDLYASMM